MKLRIMSFRGDHNCECDTAVAEAVFNKMTGKTKKALPEELKAKVPNTFHELERLWNDEPISGVIAIDDKDEKMESFRPDIKEIIFLAAQRAG